MAIQEGCSLNLRPTPSACSLLDSVTSIDFARGGYTIEVTDEDNPLLGDDGEAHEEDPEDEET